MAPYTGQTVPQREHNIVQAAGGLQIFSATLVRPNDTVTYASGDVISTSSSSGSIFSFDIAPRPGVPYPAGIQILSARLYQNSNQSTKLTATLYLGTSDPGVQNDNGVYTPTAAIIQARIGKFSFTTSSGEFFTGVNATKTIQTPSWDIRIPSPTAKIYGVLSPTNAYVPIAIESFTVELDCLVW